MTRTLVSLLQGSVLTWLLAAVAVAAGAPPSTEATKNAGSVVATKPSSEPTPAISHDAESAVVKVFATLRRPDLLKPWTKQSPAEVTGSGVVIEGHRILTNAHVVNYASQVQVQGNQAGDKVFATVAAIAPGIDLAVLKVEDKSFFDSRPALHRASVLPQIKDPDLRHVAEFRRHLPCQQRDQHQHSVRDPHEVLPIARVRVLDRLLQFVRRQRVGLHLRSLRRLRRRCLLRLCHRGHSQQRYQNESANHRSHYPRYN